MLGLGLGLGLGRQGGSAIPDAPVLSNLSIESSGAIGFDSTEAGTANFGLFASLQSFADYNAMNAALGSAAFQGTPFAVPAGTVEAGASLAAADNGTYYLNLGAFNAGGPSNVLQAEVTLAYVPEPFTVGMWSVADKETTGALTVTISTLPNDHGDTISQIDYRVDGGTWADSGITTTGTFDITGLTNFVEVDVELRAHNTNGQSDTSDVKSETPTSTSYTESGVIADGVNDYLSKSFPTGLSDGSLLFFASLSFTNTASASEYVIELTSTQFLVRRTATGEIQVFLEDASNNRLIDGVSSTVQVGAERCNILIGYTPSGVTQFYVWEPDGGVEAVINTSSGSANWAHTNNGYAVCRRVSTAGWLSATMYRVALWPGSVTVPDLSSSTVRDNFYNSTTGALADPAISRSAYGTPVFDIYGDATVWNGNPDGLTSNGSFVDA